MREHTRGRRRHDAPGAAKCAVRTRFVDGHPACPARFLSLLSWRARIKADLLMHYGIYRRYPLGRPAQSMAHCPPVTRTKTRLAPAGHASSIVSIRPMSHPSLPNGHAPSMNERGQLRSNGSEQRLQPVVIERVAGDHKGRGGGYADCEVFCENLPDYVHARKLPPIDPSRAT
jgi:hypothetical protein